MNTSQPWKQMDHETLSTNHKFTNSEITLPSDFQLFLPVLSKYLKVNVVSYPQGVAVCKLSATSTFSSSASNQSSSAPSSSHLEWACL